MRRLAKLLSLLTVTALTVTLLQTPGISRTFSEPLLLGNIDTQEVTPTEVPTQLVQTNPQLIEADRLLDQGTQYFNQGRLQDALTIWEQALARYRALADRQGEAAALGSIGNAYYFQGQYDRAMEGYQQSLAIARDLGNRQGEAVALGGLGNTYYALGQYDRAIEAHQQSLALKQALGNRPGEATSWGNLGLVYYALGQYDQAIEAYQQALVIARDLGNRYVEANALGNLGMVYYDLGQYEQALGLQQQQLEIAQAIGDRQGEANAFSRLGTTLGGLGQYDRAVEAYQRSLTIVRDRGDRLGEGQVLGSLGNAYYALGRYEQALDLLQQALGIAQEVRDRKGESIALGNLGLVYRALGQADQAIDAYETALDIARDLGDRLGEATVLEGLAAIYRHLGEYQRAIDLNQQALAIAKAIGDQQIEAHTLDQLGLVYSDLGHYDQAIDWHQQALVIVQAIGDRLGEANALGNLGISYYYSGQYDRAMDYHQQSFAIAKAIDNRSGEANSLSDLGVVYRALGQYEQAVEANQQALAIAQAIRDRALEAYALSNLGNAYDDLGQADRAIEAHQQALTLAKAIGDQRRVAVTLNNLAAIYLKQQKPALAETTLALAADGFDQLRTADLSDTDTISLFETQQNTFLLFQKALVAQNKLESALEIAERGRAQAITALLSHQLDQDVPPPNGTTIKALAQQQQTTFVEYSIVQFTDDADPSLYIWVVSPEGDMSFRQQSLANWDLDQLVATTRESIGVRGNRGLSVISFAPSERTTQHQMSADENLTQLYDLLIDPIADRLPTDPQQPIVFIPQGSLFSVPFAALKDHQGQYFVQQHTILSAPSIQVWQLTRDQVESASPLPPLLQQTALIVGNPTMPKITLATERGFFQDIQLSPLLGAEQEAQAIARSLQTSALTTDQATEAHLKQHIGSADWIHLATHGLLEYGDPRETGSRDMPGAIALAPGQGEDGLLTASEILQMRLRANLVVLSACDTGQGRITGDGVIGLSRAFMAAGVPRIVVSLWAIPDEPTAELMTVFYQQLVQGQTKAQALRQAMLATLENYPDPQDWAAFTLIGYP